MSASATWTVLLGLWVVACALWLWMLLEVLSWPAATWESAGLRKARWVLRVLILGWLGAALYVARARKDLRAAYAATRAERRRISTS